jgi:hypothetical protein
MAKGWLALFLWFRLGKGKVRGSCSWGGLSGWFCVDERERGQCMGLRLKEEETKSRGGAAGWFVSVNGSGAAGFGERKSKPGGGRLFGLDRFRVRFFLFFLYFSFKIAPPPICKCWKLLFIGKYVARSPNLVPQLLSFCKFDFS